MKTLLALLALGTLFTFVAGCDVTPSAADASPPALAEGDPNTVSFSVPSMECEGCAATVKDSLAGMAGVEQCVVNLESRVVTCKVKPDFKPDDAIKVIADAGYKDGALKN